MWYYSILVRSWSFEQKTVGLLYHPFLLYLPPPLADTVLAAVDQESCRNDRWESIAKHIVVRLRLVHGAAPLLL